MNITIDPLSAFYLTGAILLLAIAILALGVAASSAYPSLRKRNKK